jgi:hypothetical protein
MVLTHHPPRAAAEALGFSPGSKNPTAIKAQGVEISRYPLPFLVSRKSRLRAILRIAAAFSSSWIFRLVTWLDAPC